MPISSEAHHPHVAVALLFLAAGRLNWLEAWVYLGLMAAVSIARGLWLLRSDPGLLEEPFAR